MINGTFTKDIKINRSVRQGCPLSMILYILCIEPLIYKISQNTLIKGIKIPNCEREIKTIQHADDINSIITTDTSYTQIQKEYKKYGEVSGSKINEDKTEILTFSAYDGISKEYIKYNIKILGCFFGKK